MGDRLEEIKARTQKTGGILNYDLRWMAAEIKNLRKAAHADQLTIQRLRQEVDNLAAIADGYATEAEALKRGISAQGKLFQDAKEMISTLKRERDELRQAAHAAQVEIQRLRAIVACPVCGEEIADVFVASGCSDCMVDLIGGC